MVEDGAESSSGWPFGTSPSARAALCAACINKEGRLLVPVPVVVSVLVLVLVLPSVSVSFDDSCVADGVE